MLALRGFSEESEEYMSLEKALLEAREREATLQMDFKEAERLFAAAWQEYGSELAGDTDSRRITSELQKAQLDRRLLEACVGGKIDLSPEADQRDAEKISTLQVTIFQLETQKQCAEADIANRARVRELLAKAR